MNTNIIPVQIAYSQGLVKNYLVDGECTVARFLTVVGKTGRVRSYRFMSPVDPQTASRLKEAGDSI